MQSLFEHGVIHLVHHGVGAVVGAVVGGFAGYRLLYHPCSLQDTLANACQASMDPAGAVVAGAFIGAIAGILIGEVVKRFSPASQETS